MTNGIIVHLTVVFAAVLDFLDDEDEVSSGATRLSGFSDEDDGATVETAGELGGPQLLVSVGFYSLFSSNQSYRIAQQISPNLWYMANSQLARRQIQTTTLGSLVEVSTPI
jgi:hypothetical protein